MRAPNVRPTCAQPALAVPASNCGRGHKACPHTSVAPRAVYRTAAQACGWIRSASLAHSRGRGGISKGGGGLTIELWIPPNRQTVGPEGGRSARVRNAHERRQAWTAPLKVAHQ